MGFSTQVGALVPGDSVHSKQWRDVVGHLAPEERMPAVVFDGHEKPLRTQLSFFDDAAWSRCLDHSQSSAVAQLEHVLQVLSLYEVLKLLGRNQSHTKEELFAWASKYPERILGLAGLQVQNQAAQGIAFQGKNLQW